MALGLALRWTERGQPPKSLTLIGVQPGLGAADARERRRLDEERARVIEVEGLETFVDHWRALPLFASQGRLEAEPLAQQHSRRLRQSPPAMAWALRTLGPGNMPDYRARLGEIQSPTRLLVGELDPKFVELAGAVAARLAVGRVSVVPGKGHNLPFEAPRRVAGVLEAQLAESSGRAA